MLIAATSFCNKASYDGQRTHTTLLVANVAKRTSSALLCIVTKQAFMPMCRPFQWRKLRSVGALVANMSTTTIPTLCFQPRNGGHYRKRNEPTIRSRLHPRLLWSEYHTPRCGVRQERQNQSICHNFIRTITMRWAASTVLHVAFLTMNYPKRRSEDASIRTRWCLKPSVRQRLHLTRWRNMLCLPRLTDVNLPFLFSMSSILFKRL